MLEYGNRGTALHFAARIGDLKFAKHCIKSGTDVNKRDKYGNTPLYYATVNGHFEIVKLLLEAGADNNYVPYNWDSNPLDIAINKGHSKIAIEILKHSCNRNYKDCYGNSPLHNAVRKGNLNIVNFIMKHIHSKIRNSYLESHNKIGYTPLHIACEKGYFEIAKLLLEMGADLNALDNYGSTPLFNACESCNPDLVRLLLEKGVDLNHRNNKGNTLYHLACLNGNLEIVQILLEYIPSDLNYMNQFGNTPLHFACFKGHLDIVKYLIHKHQVSPKLTDMNGDNSLCLACENGHLSIVKWLLCSGQIDSLPDHRIGDKDYDRKCLSTVSNFKAKKKAFKTMRKSFLRKCSSFNIENYYRSINREKRSGGFSKDQEVEVRIMGGTRWFPAMITSVNEDGTYNVRCKNFSLNERNVKEDLIRVDNFEPTLLFICYQNRYIRMMIYKYLGLHNFI